MQEKQKALIGTVIKIVILLAHFCGVLSCDTKPRITVDLGFFRNDASKSDKKNFRYQQRVWHNVEGLNFEPMSLPSIKAELIKDIAIGDTLARIKTLIGFQPFAYYEGVDFRILHVYTEDGCLYEVAFLIGSDFKIKDISFRKIEYEPTF